MDWEVGLSRDEANGLELKRTGARQVRIVCEAGLRMCVGTGGAGLIFLIPHPSVCVVFRPICPVDACIRLFDSTLFLYYSSSTFVFFYFFFFFYSFFLSFYKNAAAFDLFHLRRPFHEVSSMRGAVTAVVAFVRVKVLEKCNKLILISLISLVLGLPWRSASVCG